MDAQVLDSRTLASLREAVTEVRDVPRATSPAGGEDVLAPACSGLFVPTCEEAFERFPCLSVQGHNPRQSVLRVSKGYAVFVQADLAPPERKGLVLPAPREQEQTDSGHRSPPSSSALRNRGSSSRLRTLWWGSLIFSCLSALSNFLIFFSPRSSAGTPCGE